MQETGFLSKTGFFSFALIRELKNHGPGFAGIGEIFILGNQFQVASAAVAGRCTPFATVVPFGAEDEERLIIYRVADVFSGQTEGMRVSRLSVHQVFL